MTALWQDLRYGLRMLWKRPGLTVVAVFSLAVGIGLNSATFSLVNQMYLLDPLVHEAQRVFTVTGRTDSIGERSSFAWPDREDFLSQCPSLADVLVMNREHVIAQYRPIPRRLFANVVSRNYFSFFGLRPALGRFFLETDDQALQDEPAAVLSYDLWQRDFGCDPNIIGRTIQLDHRRVTVFGVGPRGFVGAHRRGSDDLWIPAQVFHARDPRPLTWRDIPHHSLLVRLRPSVTVEAAEAEVAVVTQRLAQAYPSDMRTKNARLSPLIPRRDAEFYFNVASEWLLLPGAVLALACANVCALLTARAQSRTREIAARLALGSSRGQLVRQMLVESMLLSLAGAVVGLLAGHWVIQALPSLLPPSMHDRVTDLRVDGRILLFTVALSLLATLGSGLLPAWQATRLTLASLLRRDAGFGLVGGRLTGLRRIVTGQLVVSVVLLCVASLFLHAMVRRLGSHPALRRPDLLLVELNPREYGVEAPQIPKYLRQARERLAVLLGVQRVGLADAVPLDYDASGLRDVYVPRSETADPAGRLSIRCGLVDEHLLDIMGFRVLSGRTFTRFDDESSACVTLVSEAAALAYWPDRNAVGRMIRFGGPEGRPCEVIGVVADGCYNYDGLDGKAQPYFFFPTAQSRPHGITTFVLETRDTPQAVAAPVREALRGVDARVLPVSIQTTHGRIRTSYEMVCRQWYARFLCLFGALGLMLASIGLYAVVAYAVGRRTQEIGIRMAMGATRPAIAALVLREGLYMALVGVILGLPIAWGLARLLRAGLCDLPPADPLTFTAVPLLLAAVALLACWMPARRAAKIEPMVALRCE